MADLNEERELKKSESASKEKTFLESSGTVISKIIGAINPDLYAINSKEVKALLKEKKFWKAVDQVKPGPNPSVLNPTGYEYKFVYDSPSESLEPLYFWILNYWDADKIEKLSDTFASTPTSGHFAEQMGRATRMQEEAMKIMQTIGVLIKSVIQIIYDLRNFKLVFNEYDVANDDDPEKAKAGMIALKQRWLDNVDIKRGNTSIKAMTFSQASFATLLDAFFIVNTKEDIEKLDLNERVKRILEQRLLEFDLWKKLSEDELRKRFSMEKAWLRSQVESLKLYSKWARPYFRAANELMMTSPKKAGFVKTFNTVYLELTIMKKESMNIDELVVDKRLPLPRGFDKLGNKARTYYACSIIDFSFRGIPQRIDTHYGFGGRVEIGFKAYALTDEELKELKKRLDESDLNEALKMADIATDESLKQIEDDMREFLGDEEEKKEKKKKKEEKADSEDINPVAALFGFAGSKTKEEKEGKKKEEEEFKYKPDNYYERVLRTTAFAKSKLSTFSVYDKLKKSRGMPAKPFYDWDTRLLHETDFGASFKDVFKP